MICYRFPDRATFEAAATAAGFWNAENGVIGVWNGQCEIDIIGPITGETGWHVNAQGECPAAWDEHLVVVASAVRIWFGGPAQAPDPETLEQMLP